MFGLFFHSVCHCIHSRVWYDDVLYAYVIVGVYGCSTEGIFMEQNIQDRISIERSTCCSAGSVDVASM